MSKQTAQILFGHKNKTSQKVYKKNRLLKWRI